MERYSQKTIRQRRSKRLLWTIYLAGGILVFAALYGLWNLRVLFRVTDIYIYGNQQIRNADIRGLININRGDRLFDTSLNDIYKRVRSSPWIKDAKIKRDFTGRIQILVKEAVPAALLRLKGHTYLVDTDGELLEDIGDTKTFFLPIIRDMDPVKNKEVYREAISFVKYLSSKKMHVASGGIEIVGSRPEELAVRIDNVFIVVGTGDYERKMDRLEFVRSEIIRRNITVGTIDLRFANKIVVIPDSKGEDKGVSEKHKSR